MEKITCLSQIFLKDIRFNRTERQDVVLQFMLSVSAYTRSRSLKQLVLVIFSKNKNRNCYISGVQDGILLRKQKLY